MVKLGRPLAATGLLAGSMTVAAFWIFAAVSDLAAATTERDAKLELLAGLQARKLAAVGKKPRATVEDLAFVAESETQAAAAVDAMVRSTVLDAGATVLSSRAEAKADRASTRRRIEVEAVIEGRIEAIQKSLYRFERGAPAVFVEHLVLRTAEGGRTSGTDANAPLLHETLTLNAYWEKASR